MSAKKDTKFIKAQETRTDPGEEEIDFEKRKKIIKQELDKVLGKDIKAKHEENIRLKNIQFNHKKIRERIAKKSRRKNKMG